MGNAPAPSAFETMTKSLDAEYLAGERVPLCLVHPVIAKKLESVAPLLWDAPDMYVEHAKNETVALAAMGVLEHSIATNFQLGTARPSPPWPKRGRRYSHDEDGDGPTGNRRVPPSAPSGSVDAVMAQHAASQNSRSRPTPPPMAMPPSVDLSEDAQLAWALRESLALAEAEETELRCATERMISSKLGSSALSHYRWVHEPRLLARAFQVWRRGLVH